LTNGFLNLAGNPGVVNPHDAPLAPDETATQVPSKPNNDTPLQRPDQTPTPIPPEPGEAPSSLPKKPVLLSQLPKKPDGPYSRFRRTTYMKNRGRIPSYERGMFGCCRIVYVSLFRLNDVENAKNILKMLI
jgi:hypothetical protein